LGLLNVKYIISSYAMNVDGLTLLERIADSHIYENQYFMPRVWVEENILSESGINQNQYTQVKDLKISPNKIEVLAQGPGKLVLSEIYYPGWSAEIDGKNVSINTAYSVLRSVPLIEGEHKVVFNYVPISLYSGLVLALAAWIFLTWNCIQERK
jgi:uncharacterized membrane protein YfhO